ncbi:hypothetical protein MAR_018140 [Mya arenaria]|uniref:Uncharacterized protein n=1 Tax=Mya arenaria TaxID=6604 RepID=A0ABY7EDT2_MYAAR|nr:hypothetical protein MAR_018140 [Mya arenaria]
MRVLIMILILMDFVKKDATLAVSCRTFPHCKSAQVKRTRRHVSDDTETTYTKYNNDIDSNPAYDTLGSPSAENVPTSSKDSGFGKPDESMKADMMDGEYNTLRLHFPVTNERQDNTYNHID